MKTPTFTLLAIALCAALSPHTYAQSRYVTLKVEEVGSTNQVAIAATETFEVVSFPFPYYRSGRITVEKGGTTFPFSYQSDLTGIEYAPRPLAMAGPAIVTLTAVFGSSFCTLRIIPESFPPDKTLIIPADSAGATIKLECSTDLLNWQTATNGFYTGTNGAKFFRIRADRAP